MRKKCTSIGGQAVIEGVMMRGVNSIATAVRDEDKNIVVESSYVTPVSKKSFWYKTPIIRGFLNLISSMAIGMKSLMRSGEVFGEDAEPSKFENWLAKKTGIDIYSVVMAISVVLGIALSLFLFVFLPHEVEAGVIALIKHFTGWELIPAWVSFLMSIMEGLIRVGIFLGYIALTTLIPDVKRTYMYHGAEHKTIACYEAGLPLTVENVMKQTRFHPRCGTSFMFNVLAISIIIYTVIGIFTGAQPMWMNAIIRLICIPFICGISFEVLRFVGRHDGRGLGKLMAKPGLWLQKFTTDEPDAAIVEVAIASMQAVIPENKEDDVW